jgi:hypothetical protein
MRDGRSRIDKISGQNKGRALIEKSKNHLTAKAHFQNWLDVISFHGMGFITLKKLRHGRRF